ncbi:MAG: hypothetical protein Rubg2KO_24350 [Rubricoccaceae bacterium]
MERTPTRPQVAPQPADELSVEASELATDVPDVFENTPPSVLKKLGRVVPAADTLVRFAYRTGFVSAVSATLIWFALFQRALGTAAMPWGLALGLAALLLIPAGAAALVGWTLADIIRLPGQLRQAAVTAAGGAAGVAKKGSRIASIFRAIWALRGLALGSKDVWMRAIAAARFIRLASLPFVLALVGLFALNGLVIVGGLIALGVLAS